MEQKEKQIKSASSTLTNIVVEDGIDIECPSSIKQHIGDE